MAGHFRVLKMVCRQDMPVIIAMGRAYFDLGLPTTKHERILG